MRARVQAILAASWFRLPARTFLWAFLGLLIPGLLGWLNDLTEWARSEGQAPFPDARSLAYLGVAGIGAGSVAIVNLLAVLAENATGRAILRTPPNPADRGERGAVSLVEVVLIILVVVLVLWLIGVLR